jgi:hypothetical protein
MLISGAAIAVAQDATPSSSMLSGYPELKVTITDDAVPVDKTEVPAGYVLLTVTNSSKDSNSAGVLGPAPGKTMADLQQAAATPPASPDGFPPFLYDATILGGPGEIQPGESAQALLKIPAGDWAVFPEGNQPPAMISAVEGADSNTTDPTADVTVEAGDFFFSGFSDGVQAGQQLWAITNTGKQPHMLVLAKVPDGTTEQQILDLMTSQDTGTPVPGALKESDAQFIPTGILLLSSAETMWLPTNLDAGTYAALCFVTDPATGQPHVMEGMVSVFQVGGVTATPSS